METVVRVVEALKFRLSRCDPQSGREAAHLRAGKWGEDVAARYLKKQGMKILDTRVRVGRRAELDIVAREDETLVFVEVKTRASERMGRPLDAVKKDKRAILGRAAWGYMRRLKRKPPYFRFDVVEVVGVEGGDDPEVRHIPNAFTLPPRYRVPW